MAKLRLRRNNPYSLGAIVNYEDNTSSLQRPRINYIPNLEDKYHTITEEDTWDILAFKFYGDSKYWWILVDANDIFNPFEMVVGEVIVIPNINILLATVI